MDIFLVGNIVKYCTEVNTFQGRVRNKMSESGRVITVKCQGLWRKCKEAEGIAFYGCAHILYDLIFKNSRKYSTNGMNTHTSLYI